MAVAWAVVVLFDTIIFGLTAVYKSLKRRRVCRRSIVDVLLRDGECFALPMYNPYLTKRRFRCSLFRVGRESGAKLVTDAFIWIRIIGTMTFCNVLAFIVGDILHCIIRTVP